MRLRIEPLLVIAAFATSVPAGVERPPTYTPTSGPTQRAGGHPTPDPFTGYQLPHPPITVSTPPEAGGTDEFGDLICSDDCSLAVYAFTRRSGESTDVMTTIWNGLEWGEPERMNSGTPKASSPQLAFDTNGTVVIVWLSSDPIGASIQAARWVSTSHWSDPVRVSGPAEDPSALDLIRDPRTGVVTVIYASRIASGSSLVLRRLLGYEPMNGFPTWGDEISLQTIQECVERVSCSVDLANGSRPVVRVDWKSVQGATGTIFVGR